MVRINASQIIKVLYLNEIFMEKVNIEKKKSTIICRNYEYHVNVYRIVFRNLVYRIIDFLNLL